jgi:hypothetical protein
VLEDQAITVRRKIGLGVIAAERELAKVRQVALPGIRFHEDVRWTGRHAIAG